MSYVSKVYHKQGGDELVVASGGKITFEGLTAVTQATSITTGVTCNALAGVITTVSQTVAAGANASFVVSNNQVVATDVVVACIKTHTSAGSFTANVVAVAAGQFTIMLRNNHASAAGNNTLEISFLVHKVAV